MASSRKGGKRQTARPPVSVTPKSKTQPPSRPGRPERLLIAGILAATFLAFVNALGGDFVYDDRFQILRNPTIRALSNIPKMFSESVWQFMSQEATHPVGVYYRPLFNIALAINYHLFGLNVFGWHMVSVLFHLAATWLVYLTARQWGLHHAGAAVAALLFGLHPVHSESVAWISALPDPLGTTLALASLRLYERHYHGPGGQSHGLVLSGGLAMLAMLSKEVLVVFPLFLVIREGLDRPPREALAATASRTMKRTAPFIAVTLLCLGLRYAVLHFISKTDPRALGIPTVQVFLTVPSVLLSYARMLFIPFPLGIVYDRDYITSAADPWFWSAALGVAAMLGGTAWLVRSSAVGRRALVWMVLFLLPVLNLKTFNHEESLIHDRYLYLPSVGFCLLAALALSWLSARGGARQRAVLWTATALIAGIFFGLTVDQNRSWRDGIAMAHYGFRVSPQRPFLYNYLGAYYAQQGKLTEAEQAYVQAVNVRPNYAEAYYNLASIYEAQKKPTPAEQAYLKALAHSPSYLEAHINLAVLLTSQGRYQGAFEHLQIAHRLSPEHPVMLYAFGDLYMRTNQNQEAIAWFSHLLQREPQHRLAYTNLGLCYEAVGNKELARIHFQKAIEVAPQESWTRVAREHLAQLSKP